MYIASRGLHPWFSYLSLLSFQSLWFFDRASSFLASDVVYIGIPRCVSSFI